VGTLDRKLKDKEAVEKALSAAMATKPAVRP